MTKNTRPDLAIVQGIGQRIFSYIKFTFIYVYCFINRLFCLKKDVRRCCSCVMPHFENLNWTDHFFGTHAVISCKNVLCPFVYFPVHLSDYPFAWIFFSWTALNEVRMVECWRNQISKKKTFCSCNAHSSWLTLRKTGRELNVSSKSSIHRFKFSRATH